ncbi:hypothetical protein [Paenibacillus terrigena]|uniref:hypothetical protein n=1 Tax=Paenibacillus terrigena TaxID=369333 RepID=UPI00037D54A6|nr:hypothetical protein [Paenibacillus terrigena]
MIHKLIMIEGLLGSGKSITGQKLASELRKNNVPAKWYYEDELEHPTDHQCEACFTYDEYNAFLNSIDANTRIIVERNERRLDDYYLINYHRLDQDFPNLNMSELVQKKRSRL